MLTKIVIGLFVAASFIGTSIAFVKTLAVRGNSNPVTTAIDFRTVYCSARALGMQSDPYRVEPGRGCQDSAADAFQVPRLTSPIPSVLPPYALIVISPLARVPFTIASPIWFATLIFSFATTIAILSRLYRLPILAVFVTLFLSSLVTSFGEGQVGPTLTLLVALIALFLRRGQFAMAAITSCVFAYEPHVAAPVIVSLFLFVPECRRWIACGAAAIVVLSIIAGPQFTLEYLTVVLPAHSITEVTWYRQFSLTSLLWLQGAPATTALLIGTLSYFVSSGAGLFLGKRALNRTGDPSYLVFAPAACAVIGGPYIHLFQICVALPLLFLLIDRNNKSRWLAFASLALLSFPLQTVLQLTSTDAWYSAPPARIASNQILSPAKAEPNPILESIRARADPPTNYKPTPEARRSLIPRAWTWTGLILALISLALL